VGRGLSKASKTEEGAAWISKKPCHRSRYCRFIGAAHDLRWF